MPLLEMTSIPRSCYFVLGNHDFDRSYLEMLNHGTIASLQSRDLLNAFLEDEVKRDLYLRPFAACASFLRSFTGATYFDTQPASAYSDWFDVSG